LPAIRLVIFDVDGTLVDFPFSFRAAVEETFTLAEDHLGPLPAGHLFDRLIHHDLTIWADYVEGRIPIGEVWRRRFLLPLTEAGRRPTDELLERMVTHFEEALGRLTRPYPDALPCLEELSPRYRLAYLTNAPARTLGPKLERTGLGRFFCLGAAAEDLGGRKPAPEAFTSLLAEAGVEPSEAVMVGDDWLEDVAGARAAGLRAVWVRRPGGDIKGRAARALAEDEQARSYALVVQSLDEFPALLEKLSAGS